MSLPREKLPPPMTPADCDLRGYDFMPLFGHKLFSSSLYTESTDTEFRAALRLWWSAWNQVPAGSLPDNDQALATLSDFGKDIKGWKKVKAMAMRGFVLCADGRFYHPMLSAEAVESYEKRIKHDAKRKADRDRLIAWRDTRRKRGSGGDGNGPDTQSETHSETLGETSDETRFVAAMSQVDSDSDSKKTSSLRSLGDEPPAEPPPAEPPDPLKAFFAEAKPALAGLLGKPIASAGQALGKLRAAFGNDDQRLLEQIRIAVAAPPADPMSWLMARRAQQKPTASAKPPPCPEDPAEAWREMADSYQTDRSGRSRPVVGSSFLDLSAQEFANVTGIRWDWRGDWSVLVGWLRDGKDFDTDILPVIRRIAERPGYETPGSLRYFDQAVRAAR